MPETGTQPCGHPWGLGLMDLKRNKAGELTDVPFCLVCASIEAEREACAVVLQSEIDAITRSMAENEEISNDAYMVEVRDLLINLVAAIRARGDQR